MKPVTLFKAISMALVLLFAASNPLFAAPASSPTQEKMPGPCENTIPSAEAHCGLTMPRITLNGASNCFKEDLNRAG